MVFKKINVSDIFVPEGDVLPDLAWHSKYIQEFDKFPPILVIDFGSNPDPEDWKYQRYTLHDGYHRVSAAKILGREYIKAEVL